MIFENDTVMDEDPLNSRRLMNGNQQSSNGSAFYIEEDVIAAINDSGTQAIIYQRGLLEEQNHLFLIEFAG